MRANRFFTVTMMSLMVLMQFGCNKSDGDQYIGKWTRVAGQDCNEIVIIRNGNGDDFYVSHQEDKFNDNGDKIGTVTLRQPAAMVDGKMIVSAGIQYAMTIDKSSGHLVTPGSEFERVK